MSQSCACLMAQGARLEEALCRTCRSMAPQAQHMWQELTGRTPLHRGQMPTTAIQDQEAA
jgi:phosphoheptose isomerase